MKAKATLLFVLVLLFSATAFAQSGVEKKRVFTFTIADEIAPPTWRLTKKAFAEAKEAKADIILLQLNTYGGMLDAADSIRTKILNSPIPVYVFINNNAASAGALIAIACDSIYMRQGANIGAASVVNGEGQIMPDKYQSYMRSIMRSTAEKNGRNPLIAEAMVDPRTYIEGINDSGKVLTFTASEALKNNYCEGITENLEGVLQHAGITNYEVIEYKPTTLDKLINFLISPAVSGILILMIIGGLYFELQQPGIGLPLVIAVTGAVLYFAPLYLEGLAANWEIVVFIVGVILLMVELFAIPGFGVLGISGIALMVCGLTLSLIGNVGFDFSHVDGDTVVASLTLVTISTFVGLGGSIWAAYKLFNTRMFSRVALLSEQRSSKGYVSSTQYNSLIGAEGIAYTDLRPAGKIEIAGTVYDATALTGYITKGKAVVVVQQTIAQLTVKEI
ncbi:MAG: nodulation protein NfeD [Sphingobacteriales bacterium JAD_PAG50586_3]|nr:MAG: nodulation protein NfeD [Sphingobacteriales bacterium JAD_PAG50586_3]